MVINIKVISTTESCPTITIQGNLMNFPQDASDIKLNYGTRQVAVRVKNILTNTSVPVLIVNEALANELLLKDNQKLHLNPLTQKEFNLGPLIGYFVSNTKMKKIKSDNYDSVSQEFINSAKALAGEAFLFCVDDIDCSKSSIRGYSYSQESPTRLLETIYPFPRVIYNRCFGSNGVTETAQMISKLNCRGDIMLTSPARSRSWKYTPLLNHSFEPARIMGCPAEVRLLMQRDYLGDWQYSAGVINLKLPRTEQKKKGYFKNYPLDCGLKDLFPSECQTVKANLIENATKEAEILGEKSPELLEMDILVKLANNGEGQIKKIREKPQKNFAANFRGSSLHLAVIHPVSYCFKLAGFPLQENPEPIGKSMNPYNRPVIGIFEELAEIKDIKSQEAGYYQLLLARASAELGCITYHFSLNEIKGINCINGFYYDSAKQKWLQKQFPWPQVFYDRATFPYDSQKKQAKEFRKTLKRFGRTMFLNTKSVFGKGYASEVLAKMPLLKNYLPFNVNNPSPKTVKDLLNRYNSVFIKTEHGSNLEGVMKITRHNHTYSMSSKYKNASFPNFEELWLKILSIVGSNPFVAQEGVSVALYRSQPLNIRAIVQKNIDGIWEVGLVKPWIATTPEIRGYPSEWTKTMDEVFSSYKNTADIYAEICNVSLMVAKTLEAQVGHLGELGIDLVLDPLGHPWIIEVNGKTNKIFFLKDAKPDAHYNLYYNPIAYGCFLTRNYSC